MAAFVHVLHRRLVRSSVGVVSSKTIHFTKYRTLKNKYFGSVLKLDANSKSEKYLCCLRLVLRILDDDKSWRRTLSTLPIAKLKCQTPSDTCPFNCQYRSTSLVHVHVHTRPHAHPPSTFHTYLHSPGRKMENWNHFLSHFTQITCGSSIIQLPTWFRTRGSD